jgi:hypothetical protein
MKTKVDPTRFAQGGLIGLLFSCLVVALAALLVEQTDRGGAQADIKAHSAALVEGIQGSPTTEPQPVLVPAAPVVGQGLYQDTTGGSSRLEDARGWISFNVPDGWITEIDAELVKIAKDSSTIQITLESASRDLSSRARLASELGIPQSAVSIFAGEERGLTGHKTDAIGFIFSDTGRYVTLVTSDSAAFEASQEIARSLRWLMGT